MNAKKEQILIEFMFILLKAVFVILEAVVFGVVEDTKTDAINARLDYLKVIKRMKDET